MLKQQNRLLLLALPNLSHSRPAVFEVLRGLRSSVDELEKPGNCGASSKGTKTQKIMSERFEGGDPSLDEDTRHAFDQLGYDKFTEGAPIEKAGV